jgi:methylated-DNA-[protein]-cysteine S-methyltransferase
MQKPPIWIGNLKPTPLKEVWAAMSENGLIRVDFSVSQAEFSSSVQKQTGREVEYTPDRLADVTRQIKEYLDGERRTFDLRIDWLILVSDFQRAALRVVFAIPYGQTRTYARVARQIGHPDAPRAVGRANATNPMPLVIPCHRVIGIDGQLHGYGGAGGLRTKAWLLKLEHAKY